MIGVNGLLLSMKILLLNKTIMSLFKKTLQAKSETRKKFDYELDGITLNFTLRIDIIKELKAFKEILEEATNDVIDELDKF